MKMKKLMALVLALTLVLALAACGQTSTPAEGGDTAAPAEGEQTLIVDTARSESLNNAVIENFEADTVIHVEVVTGGTGEGMFSPDATCTRAQSVTFLYRASGSPAVRGGSAFSDVAANAYYADAVAWAEKNGVTGGIGGGLFGSGNTCTRAQIVTFLYRAYQGK